MATTLEAGRLVGVRFDAAGVGRGRVEIAGTSGESWPLGLAPRPSGGWVVTWVQAGMWLRHSLVSADGESMETLGAGALGEFDHHFLSGATADRIWTWLAECRATSAVPEYECDLVRREADASGVVTRSVLRTGVGVRERPLAFASGTSDAGSALVWVSTPDASSPSRVMMVFVAEDGTASSEPFELGTYTPIAEPDGLLGAPLAVAVRAAGAAVLTPTELVLVDRTGSSASETRVRGAMPDGLRATVDGYRLLRHAPVPSDSLLVDELSATGELMSTCTLDIGVSTARDGATLAGEGSTSIVSWIDGRFLRSAVVGSAGCEAAVNTWAFANTEHFPADVRTAWPGPGGLAVFSPGAVEPPLEYHVVALDADAAPNSEALPMGAMELVTVLATTDTAWVHTTTDLVALTRTGEEVGRRPATRRSAWTGDQGWLVDTERLPGGVTYELQRVTSGLGSTGPSLRFERAAAEILAGPALLTDAGLLLLVHPESATLIDPASGVLHHETVERPFLAAWSVCGGSCWLLGREDGSERLDWSAAGLLRSRALTTGSGPRAVDGVHLLVFSSTGALRLYDRRANQLLDELLLDVVGVARPHLAPIAQGRFALAYEADDAEGGRSMFVRIVEVVE